MKYFYKISILSVFLTTNVNSGYADHVAEQFIQNALISSDATAMESLLYYDLEVNFELSDGETLLSHAVNLSNFNLVKLLIDEGANVNFAGKSGWLPLHLALVSNNVEIAKYLVKHKADPAIPMPDGTSVLDQAIQLGNDELITIIENKIKPNKSVETKEFKPNINHMLVASEMGNIEIMIMLWVKGIDINSRNEDGFTPLMFAANAGQLKAVKFLLDNNAKINQTSNDGVTALMLAAINKHNTIVETLVDHGADISKSTIQGIDVLSIARAEENEELESFILKNQELSKEEIKEVQRELKNLGYDVGTIDGVFGKNTQLQASKFQFDNGYIADGLATKLLFDQLFNKDKKFSEKIIGVWKIGPDLIHIFRKDGISYTIDRVKWGGLVGTWHIEKSNLYLDWHWMIDVDSNRAWNDGIVVALEVRKIKDITNQIINFESKDEIDGTRHHVDTDFIERFFGYKKHMKLYSKYMDGF